MNDCSNRAEMFKLLANGRKAKICQDHISNTITQFALIFPIAAYDFIESSKDAALYEERRGLWEVGTAALNTKREKCEEEWLRAQNQLKESCETMYRTVTSTYQEMWFRCNQRYQAVLREVEMQRNSFEMLLQSKQHQLSPEERNLCQVVTIPAPFRVVLGDIQVEIAEMMLRNFYLLPVDKGVGADVAGKLKTFSAQQQKVDVAHQAVLYANEVCPGYILEDYQSEVQKYQENRTNKLLFILPDTGSEEMIAKAASDNAKTALVEIGEGKYDTGIEKLQESRKLLLRRNLSKSELGLQVGNFLAEAYHQTEKYRECIQICEELLQSRSQYSSELWKSLYLLSDSHDSLKQHNQRQEAVRQWTRELEAVTPVCECVRLYIQADIERVTRPDCVELYEQALVEGDASLPKAYITALARIHLGEVYESIKNPDKAAEQFCLSLNILAERYPKSCTMGRCLNSLGSLYRLYNNEEEAERLLKQAYDVLKSFNQSPFLGLCQFNLGRMYELHRKEEARENLQAALPILSQHYPSYVSICQGALRRIINA